MSEEQVYCIRLTYRDDENDQLLTIGGAGWNDQETWDHQWNLIPVAKDDADRCLAEKIDENDLIVADQYVSTKTVESLMGEPIEQLIYKAQQENN